LVCITRVPYDSETQAWIAAADSPKEKEKRKQRAKYLRHKEGYKARKKAAYDADPAKYAALGKIQRKRHATRIVAGKKAWKAQDRAKHPEKYKEKWLEYSKNNKESIAAYGRKWRKENPGKNAAKQAKYKAARLQRTPAWADQDAILFFYECCPAGCEVDHIIPLQAENISGLHVAENLQWLPKSENRAKHNNWVE